MLGHPSRAPVASRNVHKPRNTHRWVRKHPAGIQVGLAPEPVGSHEVPGSYHLSWADLVI